MNCPICKYGTMRNGLVTVTLERAGVTLVVKNVPADVCDNCGEEFVSERTTGELLRQGEAAVASGVEVQVRSFAA